MEVEIVRFLNIATFRKTKQLQSNSIVGMEYTPFPHPHFLVRNQQSKTLTLFKTK